jgi:hypothetical protein
MRVPPTEAGFVAAQGLPVVISMSEPHGWPPRIDTSHVAADSAFGEAFRAFRWIDLRPGGVGCLIF